MADLRSRFIEDYAGGILNISRQEFSTSGEVASQDGLPTDGGTLYVEDGSGTKSGLRLGVGLAETVDPTTETGCVNVRFADRTYAKLRDLKLFTTAIASAQAALSEASATSITNLETALQLLETDISSLQQAIQTDIYDTRNKLEDLSSSSNLIEDQVKQLDQDSFESKTLISGLTRDLTSLTSQFNAFRTSTQSAIDSFRTTVSQVAAANTVIENDLVIVNEKINVIRTDITSIEQRINVIESQIVPGS